MQKIKHFLFLLFVCNFLHAQTIHVSCNSKQVCYWSDASSSFSVCGNNEEYPCMWTLNSDQTIFTHTTSDMKSSYYVSDKEYSSQYDAYIYNVTSDVGNKYTIIIDIKNYQFKTLSIGHSSSADDYVLIYDIKSSWQDN